MKIVMLGAPGAGKGTYASKILAPELNVPHISTGDLFRAEAASGSELSAKIKEIIDQTKTDTLEEAFIAITDGIEEKELLAWRNHKSEEA